MRRSTPPASVFGQRLRAARLHAGIPQDRLGVLVGLDEGTASARISRYETGIHAPPYDFAAKLAKVLDVPTAYFYCDDELAPVILAWGKLSKSAKKRIADLIESESPDRKRTVAKQPS